MPSYADLLYGWLPGLYRDKDQLGELRSFLQIAAQPLEELDASIQQLYRDFFIASCSDVLIPRIGSSLGVILDTTQPAWAQRLEVGESLEFYRSKGLPDPLAAMAGHLTRQHVQTVDFSGIIAQTPFLQDANPVLRRSGQAVIENPPGSGNFFFSPDQRLLQLYNARNGRPITRESLSGHEAEFAGAQGFFSIKERGADVFRRATAPFLAIAADLTDFAHPKGATGTALTVAPNQVALDPVLGRFQISSPRPLAGNLTVDYEELVPASLTRQTFDIKDPARMETLGRIDDPAPYTLDLRTPRSPRDKFGRMHFDNHGFFFTLGQVVANRRPNLLSATPPAAFTFDDRPLATGDTAGIPLQLLDAFDGSPITRNKLAGRVSSFCGTGRGFAIRIDGVSITDPAFQHPTVRLAAADLSNFASPKDASGAPLGLPAFDVAIDPELGRFLLNIPSVPVATAAIRVDYLLGPAIPVISRKPAQLTAAPTLFTFAEDGSATLLRDGFDGTPVSVHLRLGRSLARFHGTSRGWVVRRNGADISSVLPAEIKSLSDPSATATPGSIAIDPDLGRFCFPAGFLAAGDQVSAEFHAEDLQTEARLLDSFSQRVTQMLPAGAVPVIVDTRKMPVNPAVLL